MTEEIRVWFEADLTLTEEIRVWFEADLTLTEEIWVWFEADLTLTEEIRVWSDFDWKDPSLIWGWSDQSLTSIGVWFKTDLKPVWIRVWSETDHGVIADWSELGLGDKSILSINSNV